MPNESTEGSLVNNLHDPLEGLHGKPMISTGRSSRYLGRIVAELYEDISDNATNANTADVGVIIHSDADGIAYTTDIAEGLSLDHTALAKRIVAALSTRLERKKGDTSSKC